MSSNAHAEWIARLAAAERARNWKKRRSYAYTFIAGAVTSLLLVWAGIYNSEVTDSAARLAECNAHAWPKPGYCAEFSLSTPKHIED